MKSRTGNRKLYTLVVAGAVSLMASPPAGAVNLLVNGGFELPNITFFPDIPVGSTSITGWTVTRGSVDLTDTTCCIVTVPPSTQAVDLIGDTSVNGNGQQGGLAQSFATVIGQTYQLTFTYTHNYGSTATTNAGFTALVLVADNANNSLLSEIVTHNTPADAANPGWQTFIETFVATSLETTLSFTSLSGGRGGNIPVGTLNGGIYLDNVSVEAVLSETPIPPALPLFATGLGAIGLIAHRRKREARA